MSFGFVILSPTLLTKDVICFFFGWKYLLFLSPYSYQRALLRTIVPHVLIPTILESLNFILSSSALRESLYDVRSLVCNFIISNNRIDSSLRFHLAFFFEKAIVKARISILIISQYNPLSLTRSCFFANIGIVNVNSST